VRILGIDPGTSNPGLALINYDNSGLFHTPWRIFDSPICKSLDDLYTEMIAKAALGIDCVAVENVDASTFHSKNGCGSGLILKAVGAAELLAKTLNVPIISVASNTWRKAITGNGRASKEDVAKALRLLCRGWPTMKNGEPKDISKNRTDAMAIAITGGIKLMEQRKKEQHGRV
jgi:Holliday junction resolvasome RuvABC endonuclease subunit